MSTPFSIKIFFIKPSFRVLDIVYATGSTSFKYFVYVCVQTCLWKAVSGKTFDLHLGLKLHIM